MAASPHIENRECEVASSAPSGWTRGRAAVLLAAVAIVWLVIDRLTKIHFDQFEVGDFLGGPYAGLFDFTLVHNTGAAWGLFGNSTFVLGVFSIVACAVIGVVAVVLACRSNWLFTLGAALIVAGGLGNAFDRFFQGYVVDFINLAFVHFPVFNIADIGVTCGFALVVIAILFFWNDGARSAVTDADPENAEVG